jgi:hypothetical protein
VGAVTSPAATQASAPVPTRSRGIDERATILGVLPIHRFPGFRCVPVGNLSFSSLGSLITLNLVERYPAHYAGALPVCGILGGGQTTIDYSANIRLLFDFFYPGALPGDVSDPQGLTAAELGAFTRLVHWVESGVRP